MPVTRRRAFQSAAGLLGANAALAAAPSKETGPIATIRKPLRVQPVLVYKISTKREQTSWRGWGGLFTETEVTEEKARIQKEMDGLKQSAEFAMEILPLRTAASLEACKAQGKGDHDVLMLYASTGPVEWLEALTAQCPWTVFFVRHRSGPVSEWYEIVSPRFLRKMVDEWGEPRITTADVVVDSMAEVLWRMRALYGVKNTMGRKIVALGGASGWGAGGRKAPQMARDVWKLDIAEFGYDELGRRMLAAKKDDALAKRCKSEAAAYLAKKDVKLETKIEFVENAFVLTDVLRKVMQEHGADAFTINSCMSTIMPIGETTACLPLSLLNDEGALAFCESDFVVIPSGILLQAISGKPQFLNDPTYPHDGIITLAHCTSPRKLDGKNDEPVRMLTHFESDYGASPKVEMRLGEKVTNIIPDFSAKRWVGFEGVIEKNPFLPICRSQIDIGIQCDTDRLAEEMRGFHWMTCYGSWTKELGYALKKAGVEWLDLNRTAPPPAVRS
jgi:hypothetical protein